MNTEAAIVLENIIDLAYKDWLKQNGKEAKRRKHPSREEYGVLFRQIFPWAGTVVLATQKQTGGTEDAGRPVETGL
jgi:hypothetical protein